MMFEPSSSFNLTSHEFEQVALSRFRDLVKIIPPECKVFRETWDYSTVLCLDFKDCPYFLEVVKENSDLLLSQLKNLGLGKSIIFRLDHHVRGWRTLG
jgi:hypothetical protein